MPFNVSLTNAGPVPVNVQVSLPPNMALAAAGGCVGGTELLNYVGTATSEKTYQAVYAVTAAMALANSTELPINATDSAALTTPVRTVTTADLKYAAVQLNATIIGQINRAGKRQFHAPVCSVCEHEAAS